MNALAAFWSFIEPIDSQAGQSFVVGAVLKGLGSCIVLPEHVVCPQQEFVCGAECRARVCASRFSEALQIRLIRSYVEMAVACLRRPSGSFADSRMNQFSAREVAGSSLRQACPAWRPFIRTPTPARLGTLATDSISATRSAMRQELQTSTESLGLSDVKNLEKMCLGPFR